MKNKKIIIFCAICLLGLAVGIFSVFLSKGNQNEVTYEEFLEKIKEKDIEEVVINYNSSKVSFTDKDGAIFVTDNPRYDDFKKDLLLNGVKVEEAKTRSISSYTGVLFDIAIVVIGILIIKKTFGKEKEFGNINEKPDVTFEDVAGLSEVKEDLLNVVDFLSDTKKYEAAGAKLPKGVLLYGPPGTGKTLLAKAIAGECKANFISVAGSDFSNKFVGVGGDRVRQLFKSARNQKPCILFIDEIDAVGGTRSFTDANSEDRNTLNALLAEMDGFKMSDGVLVIGATNRMGDLDPALIRPGRFDNIFAVPLPVTNAERREVIDVYIKNKTLADDVDLDSFAKSTIGSSPAEIESVINEATILAAKRHKGIIHKGDIDEAFLKKILKGHVRDNQERDEAQLKITAWHEAGHALVGILLGQDVSKVTILPSSTGAGGFTIFSPEKLGMYSKTELENRVMSIYGGRAAESLLVGCENVTTGASADISSATDLIGSMVKQYGMWGTRKSKLLDFNKIDCSDELTTEIMGEMADYLYNKTLELLEENKDKLELLAVSLLEHETLSDKDVRAIVFGK